MLATVPVADIARAPGGYRRDCPCCGYRTLPDICPGSYEVCPVCYWEDDLTQFENPESSGGANRVSLSVAKRNFAEFGACDRNARSHVRPPLLGE
ncbi:CPCC family cysteine-rich protein [Denitromonas iodatirespirans]